MSESSDAKKTIADPARELRRLFDFFQKIGTLQALATELHAAGEEVTSLNHAQSANMFSYLEEYESTLRNYADHLLEAMTAK